MTHQDIRDKFKKFFESKGHTWVASSSLLPDDPSVLFTTAGMQQFKPYYTNPELAPAKNVASIQKCVRTSDIDEVGDESHLTFFEMLGNFSFGGYWKKEAIQYAHEFITKEMGLVIDYVTIFDPGQVPSDDLRSGLGLDSESYEAWKSLGFSEEKIHKSGLDNFWGPTGNQGPCGPTTEIYVKNKGGKSIEIWNIVFNQFFGTITENSFTWKSLDQHGIDTGMGLERLAMVSQDVPTIYETDLFALIIDKVKEVLPTIDTKSQRIIADHIKASVFLLSDGIEPSNKDRGYILRRLIRRAVVRGNINDVHFGFDSQKIKSIAQIILKIYKNDYPEFKQEDKCTDILDKLSLETRKFRATIEKGLKVLSRRMRVQDYYPDKKITNIPDLSPIDGFPGYVPPQITGKWLFDFYQSFGFPFELTLEVIQDTLKHRFVDFEKNKLKQEFNIELEKHQEKSRTASAGMFKGGLADQSEVVVRYHTATHLLNAALRKVLGDHVMQKGSNINAERMRFDFSHPAKLTDKEKTEAEKLVNEWIQRDLPVTREEMSQERARELGAIGAFGEKYGDIVSVYTISDPESGETISREFCGGPHVDRTGVIGAFKLIKEEAVSAGIRRIKATIS